MRWRRTRRAEPGIALVLVLWVVALLSIIAVGLTATQRTETTLAANQIAAARFRALADAGINYAVMNLLAQPLVAQGEDLIADLWVPDGSPRPWSFAGESLEISVVNEASLVDLNQAEMDLLSALLFAAGVPEGEEAPLVAAILDWRDENDLHLLNGAEDADYRAADISYGAKDGPFDSAEELRQVMGFDRELYRILAPALTVDSGNQRVDREFAPPLVVAALEGLTLEEAELKREEQEAQDLVEGAARGARAFARGGPLYRIRVSRRGEQGAAMSMEALVYTDLGTDPPFRVLWRRYGMMSEFTPVAEAGSDE